MNKTFTQEDIMDLLDKLYEQCINGIDKIGVKKISKPVSDLADDYLNKYDDIETASKKFINYQLTKCTTSGFLTGLGGLITLPVAIPANIGSVLYVQMRMIAALAYMGGYDLKSDQVQTLVYATLAGVAIGGPIKKASINIGEKVAIAIVDKIPAATLKTINQKVGFRLFTKFGSKGIINFGKVVPVAGGFISGGFDFVETKAIAKRAHKLFIDGELYTVSDEPDYSDIEI